MISEPRSGSQEEGDVCGLFACGEQPADITLSAAAGGKNITREYTYAHSSR
jgi:hypothetical protein